MDEKEKVTDEVCADAETPDVPETSDVPEMGEELSEEEKARFDALRGHPMFARFAKGKSGTDAEICRDFEEMLALADKKKTTNDADIAAKMTPPASNALLDVALTARQKEIARAAGMTYKEYYELIGTVRGLR